MEGPGLLEDQINIDFEVGNTYEDLGDQATLTAAGTRLQHKWSCYVKTVDEQIRQYQHRLIESVKMEVKPLFNIPTKVI